MDIVCIQRKKQSFCKYALTQCFPTCGSRPQEEAGSPVFVRKVSTYLQAKKRFGCMDYESVFYSHKKHH